MPCVLFERGPDPWIWRSSDFPLHATIHIRLVGLTCQSNAKQAGDDEIVRGIPFARVSSLPMWNEG
jgi:hypothetical protein